MRAIPVIFFHHKRKNNENAHHPPPCFIRLAVTAILVSSSNLKVANSPADTSPSQIVGNTYRLDRMYLVSVHVPSGSVDKVLQSLAAAVGLEYGNYDQVAFIDAEGLEQYRPLSGSKAGAVENAKADPSKVVTVSLIHDATVLHKALDAIYQVHPYEEPVIYVTEGWRSRSTSADESNPNRWWNQKPQ